MSQQREARRRGRTAEAYFDYVVMQHKNWQVAEPKIETTWDRLINVGFGSRFKKGVEYEEFYVSAVYKRVQVKRVYLVKGRRTVRLKRGAEGGKYRSYDADYLAAVDVWDERVWLIPWGLVYKFSQKCIDLAEFQKYEIATQVDRSPPVPHKDPDISKCPKCKGPADNGFDRCYPPNPYYCTKCQKEEENEI